MRIKSFLKAVAVIVTVTFFWTNCVYASGLSSNYLAAAPKAAEVGAVLAGHPVGASLLHGEAVLEGLGVGSLGDIVKNMSALTEAGVKCFISRDDSGNTAEYIIEDGALLRKTPSDKQVSDKFYRALKLLNIQGKSEIVDGEFREYIYVTEKNDRFINSILALLSNNNSEWVVKAVKQLASEPVSQLAGEPVDQLSGEPVGQANRTTGETSNQGGFSTVGAMVMTAVLSVVGALVYAYRGEFSAWIFGKGVLVSVVIFGLIGYASIIIMSIIASRIARRIVSPVDWHTRRLINSDNSYIRLDAVRKLGRIGNKDAIAALLGLLADHDPLVRAEARNILEKSGEFRDEEKTINKRTKTLIGMPVVKNEYDKVQSPYTQLPAGKEEQIIQMSIDNKETVGMPVVTGDLAKLAGILGVDASQAPEAVKNKLQGMLASIAEKYPGLLGAARQIVLVDNLGGLDSDIQNKRSSAGRFQNGVIAIDIDAFKNDKVLYDVVLHELRHSILEVVESNKGIEEAAAIWQSLLYFTELVGGEQEQTELITFLKLNNDGLESKGYADLLQMVQEKGLEDEQLIPVAISYVLTEPRYSGMREGLMEGMSQDVKAAVAKLNLAVGIYGEIAKAIAQSENNVPAVGKVRNADKKAKILMKVKMLASRWSVDLGFIDILKGQGKYIQLDVDELEKNPHVIDWLKRLTAEQQGAFIFKSGLQTSAADFLKKHGVQGIDANDIGSKGIARGKIITLLELGGLNTSRDMQENSGFYLPYIYSVTGIYLAAQIILANGNFEDIEDNLVKTALMSTLGLSDPKDLNDLFRGKWPQAFHVSEIINELREAIRLTESAA